jgi:hypothetical protein
LIGWLIAGAITPALATIGKALAQAKVSKDAVKYQNKPNGGNDCDDCIHFVAGRNGKGPGTCKVVDGPISPQGWCIAFMPK